jgi:hypothetical protein
VAKDDSQKPGSEIVVANSLLSGGFVQVPILLLRDHRISAGAKIVYGALLWHHWRNKEFPGQEQLAEDFGFSARSALTYLKELETSGYIEVERPGLGQANRYFLPDLWDDSLDRNICGSGIATPNPDRNICGSGTAESAVLDRNICGSLINQDSTTQTLSHTATETDALTATFFTAIGENKPAKKRRERAQQIIGELLNEGFAAPVIEEACRLAKERGARGPDLLPHLVGEAHASVQATVLQAQQWAQDAATARAQGIAAEEAGRRDLAMLDALAPERQRELEQEARAHLPGGGTREIPAPILRGAMIGILKRQQSR